MTLGPTSYIMNINTIYISKLIIYTDIFIFYFLYYSIITFSPTERLLLIISLLRRYCFLDVFFL